ncbi:MAG: 3-hydroxyacyl-[acyl-carrier-protein] dehydratase FabZ [Alphaproteobacteria bacterium MarineAlpha8_Bin1]|nr:MAG: 3-hydroxyacyl-[acyl-carrier-protein] dehydratase FabZ [Alphaproteobacteria bacterium MarineAlpha8_Bin1]|tara:strand:- start:170 stop:616 length:447 start_codon:yes stop_codon:yes gene_type:complete
MNEKVLNIEDIKNLIPHRYPFLLIDKLKDIIPFESATGIKNVTFNENYFQGHFESRSVMPGALIIESMAQSAGTLVMYSLQKTHKNTSVYLLTVDKARFRKPVCPGDILVNQVKKKRNLKNIWKFNCFSYVDNKLVAEAEISAILNNE